MSFSKPGKCDEQLELLGRLCNEDLDVENGNRLRDVLTDDVEAQRLYIRYLDLQAALRHHARSIDDEDFALLEAQAALDTALAGTTTDGKRTKGSESAGSGLAGPRAAAENWFRGKSQSVQLLLERRPIQQLTKRALAWTAIAALIVLAFAWGWPGRNAELPVAEAPAKSPVLISAQLRGTIAARWAGDQLELPEGEKFIAGRRLELIEGLAEIFFNSETRVILQGPAIIEIRDSHHALVPLGRITVAAPESGKEFAVQTRFAEITAGNAEYGVEVEVDGELATQVYTGEVKLHFQQGNADTPALLLASGQGVRVDGVSGRTTLLPQPNSLHFVRNLPHRETLVNLAEVVAGGHAGAKGSPRGVSLVDGEAVNDYGVTVVGDGKFKKSHSVKFVDGVFIPNGKLGSVQVDSIGRLFAGFPATTGDCWGGAIMARQPSKEDSLPLIRLEQVEEVYGYVNWLHIAERPEELSPAKYGLIGMHSNSGVAFDLHAMRAEHPDKRILRFRALVGNLESKPESAAERHSADAWVIVDGKLRHHRKSFCREDGAEAIDVPLTDRDRFLVLAVTDDGSDTAYDWVAFGDAVIEMTSTDGITFDRGRPWPRRELASAMVRGAVAPQLDVSRWPAPGGADEW